MDYDNNENFQNDNAPEESQQTNQEPVSHNTEAQNTQYVWHNDDYIAGMNSGFNNSPATEEPSGQEQSGQPYFTDSQTYKQTIKSMKQDYKAARREEKKRAVASEKSTFTAVLASVLCTLLAVCIIFVFLIAVPTPGNSVLGKYIRSVTNYSGNPSAGAQLNGGQYYAPNKETITIKDETTNVCTAVYAKASPSVVGISIVQVGGSFLYPTSQVIGSGTGTVYSEDGLIITNYHVIETAIEAKQNNNSLTNAVYEIRVYFDTTLQEYYTAEVIGGDSRTDLALLKISLTGMVPVEFADSDEILIGSDAIVMGGGGGIEFLDSVNKGIISGLHRNITTNSGVIYDLIQTDAAINPGNSGGALLNSNGQLIGICFLKISADAYDNMAFAIPSNTVKKIISQIEKNGRADSPYIGVSIDTTYTKQDANKFNYPQGALVADVEKGKSADRAGIASGDIITEFNGISVSSYDDLRGAINRSQVGDKVTIKIFRTSDRTEKTLSLTIDNYND